MGSKVMKEFAKFAQSPCHKGTKVVVAKLTTTMAADLFTTVGIAASIFGAMAIIAKSVNDYYQNLK